MRKLAITACFFSVAVCASQYLLGAAAQLISAAVCVIAALVSLILKKKAAGAVFLGLCLGFLWNRGWETVFLRQARELDGEYTLTEATVLDRVETGEKGKSVTLRVGHTKCIAYLYGDVDDELRPGDRVQLEASFRMRDESDYYMAQGVPLYAYVRSELHAVGRSRWAFLYLPAIVREKTAEALKTLYPEKTVAFMTALITGDRTLLEKEGYSYSMMKNAGIAHCVAVSGMHLSILTGLIYFIFGRRRRVAVLNMAVIVFFMAFTGFRASVVRAGVMQLMLCVSALSKREYDSRTALMTALMLLLAVNPCSIKNTGLQLSFAATLGIILLYDRFNIIKIRYIGPTLAVTASALVFTTPISALSFGEVSVAAPLTNLLVLWAVSLCFSLGMLSAAAFFVFAPIGKIIAFPAGILALYITKTASLIGRLPFASVFTDSLYIRLWLAAVYAVLLWLILDKARRRKALIFVSFTAAGAAAALILEWHTANSGLLRFAALDVGQGQCLVLSSRGYTAVIDCGGSLRENAGDIAAEYLNSIGKFRVDCLILTHMHADHINGAAELMRRKKVRQLIVCQEDTEVTERAESGGTDIICVEGRDIEFYGGGLHFRIIHPLGGSDDNERGLSVLCSAGEFDVLVTGDMGEDTERLLTEYGELPDIEVMMAGHHGSAYSNSKQLLDAVRPELVVISVGRNVYGHPAESTLKRISEAGADHLRTDEDGAIVFTYER